MTQPWLRLYHELADDPKVQSLPGELFKTWINILCIAKRGDGVIDPSTIAFSLRISPKAAAAAIEELKSAGFLDAVDGGLEPHNWHERQPNNEMSTPRVQRYRKRKRNAAETLHETFHSVSCNVSDETSGTVIEEDTEEEKKRTPLRGVAPAAPMPPKVTSGKRATRIPKDWQLSPENRQFALSRGLSQADVEIEALKFHNYWIAAAGKNAAKLDWDATWRSWILNWRGPVRPAEPVKKWTGIV